MSDEQRTTEETTSDRVVDVILVDDRPLRSLRARPTFIEYLRQLRQRRHFIWSQARSGVLSAGRGTFLGGLWIVLNPALQVAVYAFIFGVLLQVDRGIDNFIGFLILGVTFFGFVTGGISAGSGLIQNSRSMITSFEFPRASLAISSTVRSVIDNLAPAVLGVLAALLFQLDKPISWEVLLVIPVYLLVHVFGLGATLIVARVTAFIPDAKALVQILIRGLFFLSGVFFPVERFADRPVIQDIMMANPVYQFLRAARNCVLEGQSPLWQEWAYMAAWSFGLLLLGIIFFWRAEARYTSVK